MSDPLDGIGGFGKYKGLTLEDLDRMFDKCRQEGGMRGVSAVLRIAREQLDARGGLGSYPWLAGLCLAAAVGLWFFPYEEGPLKDWRMQGVLGALALFVLFGWTTVSTRVDRRKALYQEARIREKALLALTDIVSVPGFRAKELDYTQRLTLERLLAKTKRKDPELTRLLQTPGL